MSNPNIDFERFLQEEANKHFKALPSNSGFPLESGGSDGQNSVNQTVIKQELLTYKDDFKEPIQLVDRDVTHSGERPSTDINTSFDIHNPPTSFNDIAYYNGNIPKALGGSGIQPGISEKETTWTTDGGLLPFQETYDDHLGGLKELLGSINTFNQLPQIPLSNDTPIYYFNHVHNPIAKADFSKNITNDGLKITALDVAAIRQDFPILSEYVNGRKLIWLDNAATTQKPQVVIDRISYFYKHENSNIHRAAHALAARASDAYEEARDIVRHFLNAASPSEIIFTRGTTESINLVASTWGEQHLKEGDEVVISHLEHHANIVPWQLLSQKKGFKIRVIPVDDDGNLLLDEYAKLLNERTKLVTFTHVSNALGTVTPVKRIIELAHQVGAKVLLDGAQSVSHIRVDLQDLVPDFFVFSGHKIFGPTGIGVLYGREELLNSMPPYQGGGNMIQDVSFDKTIFHNAPNRFEAGTGNIADAVGLGAALRYVQSIGLDSIYHYEHQLLHYATDLLKQIPGIKLIGTAREKTSVLSFTLQGYSNNEVGQVLNEVGIAVRTGHHCAQPILRRLGQESSVRPSLAFYNTHEEIDLFVSTINRLARKNKQYF